jgi:signal transduction histidine kinase
MFSNLLSNAIKYSSKGELVEISAHMDNGQIVVSCRDRGIGIPAKDLDQLFERYYRGSNVSGIVGTGVGLYLVKMVVEVHAGEIAVDSKEGEGSTFTVRLPLKPAIQSESAAPSVLPAAAGESPLEHETQLP